MKVLVTGGTGFIGSRLVRELVSRGDQVFVLKHQRAVTIPSVTAVESLDQLTGIDAVVNLAGAPIADQRWSEARKQLLRDSRIGLTTRLVEWIAGLEQKPSVMVSGSAIGFYGATRVSHPVDESSEPLLTDFSSQLSREWEKAAAPVESFGVRLVRIRTGIVLGAGGALAKMRLPFLLGGGGPIAGGEQWMPWIHIDDEVAAILHLIDHQTLSGAFNLVAPYPATNRQFSQALGRALHRPAILPMPAWMTRLMLGTEASALLTEGVKVLPNALLKSGYQFQYTDLDDAMRSAVALF